MTERLTVANLKFQTIAAEDKEASDRKGYKCYRDIDIVTIYSPGDKFNVPEQEVTPDRLKYWQDNPATRYRVDAYTAWKAGKDAPLTGTPLREWPVATASEIHELIGLHILTVEQLSEMNDDACRRFGMGAQRLKQKAQAWLAAGADKGRIVEKVANQEAMLEQLLKRQEEQDKRNAELAAQNAALLAQIAEKKSKKPEAA